MLKEENVKKEKRLVGRMLTVLRAYTSNNYMEDFGWDRLELLP